MANIRENERLEQEFHLKTAKRCFNKVWEYLEKEELTQTDQDEMIHMAHASRFHWGIVGTGLNWVRGEWQISRVYATLSRASEAIYHGERCLALAIEHGVGPFDLAYAYEALARAYALVGEQAKVAEYRERAYELANRLEDQGEKSLLLHDLGNIAR